MSDRNARVLVTQGDFEDGQEALLILTKVWELFPDNDQTLSAELRGKLHEIEADIRRLTGPTTTAPRRKSE